MRVQTLLLVCALATSVVHSTVLENGLASFRLSDKNGALLEILNKETGRKVFLGQEQTATPWKILLLDNQNGVPVPRNLRATTAPEVSLRREGPAQILTLNLREDDKRCIVTATATLPDDSGVATWRLAVKTVGNASCAAPWVKELRFPCLDDIASLGEDRLIYGHFIGRQVRRPGSRLSPVKISSPGEWSMQFCAFHGTARAGTDTSAPNMLDGFHRPPMPDETGLLVAAADGDGHFKELRINRAGDERFSLNITHFPQWPFWPMDKGKALSCFDYRMPYAVHLGVFSGGQGKAVELYREIALNYPTVRKAGPLRAPNNPVSAKMKENVFWGKLYYGANHIVPGALELKKYLRVPMSIHWYKYGAHQFDDDNIDYFPLLGQFREGVQTLRQADVSVAPYVCCGVLDPDTENYRRHGMDKAIILNESMTPDIWTLCNQSSYFANPASPLWRRAYREVTSRLMGQWATDGQYLDVMAGIGGLDYAGCDNAPHGGNYWTQGNRTLLRELHEAGRKATPDPFLVTECFNEHYVGCADGFLMLDLTRYGWAFSLVHEVIPLLSHVYHDYALFYGSDCNQKVPLDQFRWNMGLSFAWGIQLCYSTRSFETPGNCPHDHFTRDLSQAWYRVGNKFLNGGRNLEMALLPAGHASGHIPALLSAPHTVNIKFDNGTRIWRGPAPANGRNCA